MDQNLDAQIKALTAAGCVMVRHERRSGATLGGCPDLKTILDLIHPSEALVVPRNDRLVRSMQVLQTVVARLNKKGAHLAVAELPVNTSTAAGKAFLDILGVFAGFETNLRRERQVEGVKASKQRRDYRGRAPKIDMTSIQAQLGAGLSPNEIDRKMGISRGTVYKAKAEIPSKIDVTAGLDI